MSSLLHPRRRSALAFVSTVRAVQRADPFAARWTSTVERVTFTASSGPALSSSYCPARSSKAVPQTWQAGVGCGEATADWTGARRASDRSVTRRTRRTTEECVWDGPK
ncbi:hypothetical protein [Halospeciosus flavus]|uniref:hypothetical protein n=1 Tax=Halospeciosus flavus TaxID=3032283 RepID=UPI00360B02A3